MKLLIIGCSGEQYWYKDKIGEEFEIKERFDDTSWAVRKEGEIKTGGVDIVDCVVVEKHFDFNNYYVDVHTSHSSSYLELCEIVNKPFPKSNKEYSVPLENVKEDRKNPNIVENYLAITEDDYIWFDNCDDESKIVDLKTAIKIETAKKQKREIMGKKNRTTNICCIGCAHLIKSECSLKIRCINYSEYSNVRKEIKMKQIVLELPEHDPIITTNDLINKNACQDSLKWVISMYGTELLKGIKLYEFIRLLESADRPDDAKWLEHNFGSQINRDDYYLIKHFDNAMKNLGSKLIYFLSSEGSIYKVFITNGHLQYNKVDDQIMIHLPKTEQHFREDCVEGKFYLFETFDDFVDWYLILREEE